MEQIASLPHFFHCPTLVTVLVHESSTFWFWGG